ncbi:MAG: DinB family protein, partial [Candidatus Babeliales bacterium]
LTEQTASVGFIYRHIGEATNLMAQFFGYNTDVEGTTMGQTDTGKDYDLETSRMLVEEGYATLEKLVNETAENEWLEEVDTSWFGTLSRINLLAITLFHNSHHYGQIASASVKGKKY